MLMLEVKHAHVPLCKPTYMKQHIGQRIREAREERGLTQGDVGKAAGVSASAVSQWESGDVKGLKPENLLAAAKKLNRTVEYLVHGREIGRAHV